MAARPTGSSGSTRKPGLVVRDQLITAADPGGGHGQARGHGLQQGIGHALVAGGHDEHVGVPHQLRQFLFAVHPAGKAHPVAKAQPLGLGGQFGPKRALAGNGQLPRGRGRKQGQCFEQDIESLLPHQPSDGKEPDRTVVV